MGLEINKSHLVHAIRACIENGHRLQQDADWLGIERTATVVALCILAQEEFAKAFLLHLVYKGVVPWTDQVRESLRNHKLKQLLAVIMEWLNPTDEEFIARIRIKPGHTLVPAHVTDAMKIYVEKVKPKGHISCPPAASDPMAKGISHGERDKMKQDAIYVQLSENGEVISVPMHVTTEEVNLELDRTKRLSDLVRPLQEGDNMLGLNYDLIVEALNFLMLEKRDRPFLLLRDSEFGGPAVSKTGITLPHSINVTFENISYVEAKHCVGFGTVFIDKNAVKPSFRFEEFLVDPCLMIGYALGISEETYTSAMSHTLPLDVYIEIEYHGLTNLPIFRLKAWIYFDKENKSFRERITHVQE